MSNGVRVEKRDGGDLWSSFPLSCFCCGQFLVWGQGGNTRGLLLWLVPAGGFGHITSGPPDWFNNLAVVANPKAIWLQPWHLKHWRELGPFLLAVSLAIFGPLGIPSLVLTCDACAMAGRYAAGWGSLFQASSAIMGVGAIRSVPVHLSPPTAPPSGAIWGTGGSVALSCSGQAAINLAI